MFDLLYASVPRIACRGKFQASCGPIDASPREKEHFERVTGKQFPNSRAVFSSEEMTCPLLNAIGQCEVHQHRPLICRLWGVAEGMPCQWGCKPVQRLSDIAAGNLIRESYR